ncbi:MAG: 50S ribosomal protein L10 [Candidatus Cyclobacteriaceae bacterium M3_2C_046]
MTRQEKTQVIEELVEKFSNTSFFYIADSSGLAVADINEFRKMCYEKGIEYRIVKNTLIQKALERLDTDYSPFNQKVLKGTSGIMFSPESNNLPAKIIKDFRKKGFEKPLLKGASIDTALFIGHEQLDTLSSLKSKDELIGDIIGLLQSPAKNVLGALLSGKNKLAGIVKTLSDKEE